MVALQRTSPIRMRATLRQLTDISEQPTQRTGAIHLIQGAAKVTKPLLPLDRSGRPYAKIRSSNIDTLKLVEEVVQQFYEIEGRWPREIVLIASRYLHIGAKMKYYFVPVVAGHNIRIPYVYQPGGDDVIARG